MRLRGSMSALQYIVVIGLRVWALTCLAPTMAIVYGFLILWGDVESVIGWTFVLAGIVSLFVAFGLWRLADLLSGRRPR
jgi:high-affinity Fe2+/Pb2+ permease